VLSPLFSHHKFLKLLNNNYKSDIYVTCVHICFTCVEVEYALNADKAVIPVRIHRSYVLDGWLSPAFASYAVLNFSDAEDFDTGMTQLLRRVSAVTGPIAVSDTGNIYTLNV